MLDMKERKKQLMTEYIAVTKTLINELGIEKVSIRKIAEKIGYNTATLYNYFENLDILLLYASLGYLKDYIAELKVKTKPISDPVLKYIRVYEVFNGFSFKNPDIYFNMFYGIYSEKLPKIIADYYEIFPEELGEKYHDDIDNMLKEGNIIRRDIEITKAIVNQGILSQKNTDFLIHTVTKVHAYYLYKVIIDRNIDIQKHSKEFMNFLVETLELMGVSVPDKKEIQDTQ
ncbi:TetR/AcrR family transcriptional regulator [Treponema sp. OMZ 799]|nr:TetR/AcrR family transcriptional regulator [Treponema sp. OMZ 787]UTC78373.1 TetR/AcrR family transcriptional regulator [Treponema sp. OMZ 799]